MDAVQWKTIRYFKPTENWGDPSKMNYDLLILLDRLRHEVGCPFVIHCGYEKEGHATKSQHYYGKAVDFHIKGMTLEQQLVAVDTFNANADEGGRFTGIGAYPFWKNNPGLHLDVRTLKPGESMKRWLRLADGTYVNLTQEVFERYVEGH